MDRAIKRAKALKLPAKASLAYIVSSAIARGIGVLGTPIFTRLLSPSEYGLFPLWRTACGLLLSLFTLEIFGSTFYRGLQRYDGERARFLTAALGFSTLLTATGGGIFFLITAFFKDLFGIGASMSVLLLVNVFSGTIIGLQSAVAKYEYRYRAVVAINLISAFLTPIIAIVLIRLSPLKAEGRIIATTAVSFALALPVLYFMLRGDGRLYDKEIWRYLLRLNLPLLPYHASVGIILRIGELSVDRLFGRVETGKYSVATSVGLSMTMITGGLLSALSPWMIRRIRAGDYRGIRDLLLRLTEIISLIALIAAAFAPETLAIIAPYEYRDVLPAVYPLLLSSIPMLLNGAITSGQAYFESGGKTALPAVAAAFASFLFCTFILPNTDYRSVSIAMLMSYFILMILEAASFKRLCTEAPICMKKTALIILASIAYSAILYSARGYIILRMMLTLPPLLLIPIPLKRLMISIREK